MTKTIKHESTGYTLETSIRDGGHYGELFSPNGDTTGIVLFGRTLNELTLRANQEISSLS